MYLLLYIGTAFNWEYFLFLNPGYFAMFAGDTSHICDLARSKASWGLKGFYHPLKSHLTIPFHMAQLQIHRLSDGVASPAPGQTSPLEQVWTNS